MTLVFARTADPAGIREALFSKRTAAWMGGEVWGPDALLRGLWGEAVKTSDGLTVRPGADGTGFRLRNNSALPFRIRCRQRPAGLRGFTAPALLPPQGELSIELGAARDATAGRRQAELELELLNFHPAPGSNLVVRVPLTLDVAR